MFSITDCSSIAYDNVSLNTDLLKALQEIIYQHTGVHCWNWYPNIVDDCFIIYCKWYTLLWRHTVVCRTTQEAGAPHPWIFNRKKNNAIFMHTYLHGPLTKPNDFCGGNASRRHHLPFQISTKSFQAFISRKRLVWFGWNLECEVVTLACICISWQLCCLMKRRKTRKKKKQEKLKVSILLLVFFQATKVVIKCKCIIQLP